MRLLIASTLFAVASATFYAPHHVVCPADLAIRLAGPVDAQTLHAEEARYVATRRATRVPQALVAFIGDRAGTVYGGQLDDVDPTHLPTIAISLSGGSSQRDLPNPTTLTSCSTGGDRAALYGAGVLRALDGREPDSVAKGTGGLLQSATYLAALSGFVRFWLLSVARHQVALLPV